MNERTAPFHGSARSEMYDQSQLPTTFSPLVDTVCREMLLLLSLRVIVTVEFIF